MSENNIHEGWKRVKLGDVASQITSGGHHLQKKPNITMVIFLGSILRKLRIVEYGIQGKCKNTLDMKNHQQQTHILSLQKNTTDKNQKTGFYML